MNPWENDGASFPRDLFRSWMEVMLRPVEFFRALNSASPFSKPLIFFLVFSVLGATLSMLSRMAGGMEGYDFLGGPVYIWFSFFASPFIALLGLAMNVGLTHLGVLLFIPTRKNIGVTGRMYCYVAAPTVMALVPFLGWLISIVWALVLSVIGIQQVHETTTGRALAAVLVPVFAIGLAFMMLGVLLAFLAVAMGGAV